MDLKLLMNLHKDARSYIYHISEAEYSMISLIETLREYIGQVLPEVRYKIYQTDLNRLTITSESINDLYDILCYPLSEFDTISEGINDKNEWYAHLDITEITEYLGGKLVEFGDDS